MLYNVPKILSPELLKTLCEMGHGDEIVIADANFPANAHSKRTIRADGIGGVKLLDAILTMMPLDSYTEYNLILMDLSPSDEGKVNPTIWREYEDCAKRHDINASMTGVERQVFYDRAREAYATIASGEEAIYANLIIRKGVIK